MICKDRTVNLLISSLAGGGSERVCVSIANGLVEKGWSVNLLVLNLDNEVFKSELLEKVNVIDLGIKKARYAFLKLFKYLSRERASTLVVFNYELSVLAALVRHLTLLNYRIISRNSNTVSMYQASKTGFYKKYIVNNLISYFYVKVDFVINQCRLMEIDLLNNYPLLKGKTGYIYNPVSNQFIDPAFSNSSEMATCHDYLLCVGRLEHQKAFDYAIKAFAAISATYPYLQLKIVGDGRQKLYLQKLAAELSVADRVEFVGFTERMIDLYANAKGTLLTSKYEGFPNVLVESITVGTPVVAFDCPSGPSEIIQNGVNGYLAKYLDIDDLITKIEELLSVELDSIAIKRSAHKFRISNIIQSYEDVIGNVNK